MANKPMLYDTNAILNLQEKVFDYGKFYLTTPTLFEIEDITTNKNKTEDLKARARKISRLLDENTDAWTSITYNDDIENIIKVNKLGCNITPDTMICACARYCDSHLEPITFVSDDINCKHFARTIFGLDVQGIAPLLRTDDEYKGFIEMHLSDEDWAALYDSTTPLENKFGLKTNEYMIITDADGNQVDVTKWNGEKFVQVFNKNLKSMYFDKIRPKDIYQRCAIDSLINNTITAISGVAGTGKSLLSLMIAMYLIETGKYDRIVCLFNPTKVRGAADMGFYSGDAIEKAMQSNIGQVLTTKFGDASLVDMLLQQEKLRLVCMADGRGTEIKDNEILWITESQNTSIDLIKLCLSRVSSGAKVFIEGDPETQVDSYAFEGMNNGLKRVIDVFSGHSEFGYIQLQNVWRSKIAELCELL